MAQTNQPGQLMCVTFWGPSELVEQAAINLQLASGHIGGGLLGTPTLSGAGGDTRGRANVGIRGGASQQFGGEIIGQQQQPVKVRKTRGPNKRTLAKRQQNANQGMQSSYQS